MHERLLYLTIIFVSLFLFLEDAYSQRNKTAKVQYRAEYVEVDKNIRKGAKRLLDNVEFIHGGANMYCDSAYFYSKKKSLDAYNNIYINQGDTIHLYGDFLHYNANIKKATVIGNVKLINDETTLTTERLEYNLDSGIAYYTNYAVTVNKENTLESIEGYYHTRIKTVFFNDSVTITNPDYLIYSDTVQYNTESGRARFFGPTDIISDSSHIYGKEGWYDTQLDLAEVKQDAWVKNKNKTIYGQYIYYNKNTGDGIARDDVRILEEDQSILLLGNHARYNDITKYAVLTDSAQFIQFSKGDSLYLHADSLVSIPDTAGHKIIFAYNNVKFFRKNVQGKCDSMVYSFSDSTARLYNEPVLWTEDNQISAKMIEIQTENQQIKKIYLTKSSFITSKIDSSNFNQIKGKNMICHFNDNQLHQIDVKGNGQTVYYPLDEGEIVGVNLSECSNIKIFLIDGQMNRINFYVKPKGGMYPLNQAPQNKLRLKGFKWLSDLRPNSRYEIF